MNPMNPPAPYTLTGADGRPWRSAVPGTVGGHRGRSRVPPLRGLPAGGIPAVARGHRSASTGISGVRAGNRSAQASGLGRVTPMT